jgi:maltose/maltodextrin transport system substrate-binding protein
LYAATHDTRYLDAAKRIAATYEKCQLPSGTWHLKVDNRTDEPIAPIELIPSVVISFLDRLVTDHGVTSAQPTRDRALSWMMENPARTFDWKAQFDDAKVRGPYENLSKHEATEFAAYLFRTAKGDAQKIALAEEILRFAEDQFVIWDHPPDLKTRNEKLKPENWFTPCSAEQYAMFEPISGSSAFMIVAYVRAYEATGKKINLDKADALANALTRAQEHHHGRYPTRMIKEDLSYWINSTINTARAMNLLADCHERRQQAK